MANEIKLEIQTFGIRERNTAKTDDSNYLLLSEITGTNDFFDVFESYIKGIANLETHEIHKKGIGSNVETIIYDRTNRTISGLVRGGAYGIESDIFNLVTGKHKLKKEQDDIELYPFYFLIYIPDDKNRGLMMLQRLGVNGVGTVFRYSLDTHFKNNFSELMIDYRPFVSKELMEDFSKRGAIQEVIITKYGLPADAVEKLGLKKYKTDVLSYEIRIKAKRNTVFKKLTVNKFLTAKNAKFFDTHAFKGLGLGDDYKVSVVSQYNGNTRTIDLSDTWQIRPYYDIDSEVEKLRSNPKFDSINAIAKTLLAEFLDEVYET